jgi:hypothetical protein
MFYAMLRGPGPGGKAPAPAVSHPRIYSPSPHQGGRACPSPNLKVATEEEGNHPASPGSLLTLQICLEAGSRSPGESPLSLGINFNHFVPVPLNRLLALALKDNEELAMRGVGEHVDWAGEDWTERFALRY